MSFGAERLYRLLPAIQRARDAERGSVLRELVEVLAEQAAVVDEELEELHDDQFIETCADWVVPYIGDLIGVRGIDSLEGAMVDPRTRALLSPRAQVANTVAYRRRKGTAAALEELARDVTGWEARVVELFQRLATTQHVNHLRPRHEGAVDLRAWEPLERLDTAFDSVSHTADVRRIASGRGRYNIPNVAVFLWRLRAHPLTLSTAFAEDERRYRFHPLGFDAPLYTRPEREHDIDHLAEPVNVPMPIGRRVLRDALGRYYGAARSFLIERDGQPVPEASIRACDLSDAAGGWAHAPADAVGVDPVLGRIAFPTGEPAPDSVRVSFHRGFAADLGGGEYDRSASIDHELGPVVAFPEDASTVQAALDQVAAGGAVEIAGSELVAETLQITVADGEALELRAADGSRPVLLLGGDLEITGGPKSVVTLNGLVVDGGAVRVTGDLGKLRLRDCTLVPADAPSLVVEPVGTEVEIERSILGPVHAAAGADVARGVHVRSSIVDAGSASVVAFADADGAAAGPALVVETSTVVGETRTRLLRLASNSIFLARVTAERRQEGCVRFSWLPLDSVVPRRHRCLPANEADAARVRPVFTSLWYGEPGYGQLSLRCAVEICRGADDESELGAFHDLYQPQREANLRTRLDEFLRFGLEAGIFYAS